MPGSPEITDRTWFGIARCVDGGVAIEGAVETWSGRHDHAQILIVDENGPIDWLLLGPEDSGEECVAKHLAQLDGSNARPALQGLPTGDLTIAICTRERPNYLRACLERIYRSRPPYPVLVVDNAPRSDATERVVDLFTDRGMDICRVVEHRAGLSRARNCALTSATDGLRRLHGRRCVGRCAMARNSPPWLLGRRIGRRGDGDCPSRSDRDQGSGSVREEAQMEQQSDA